MSLVDRRTVLGLAAAAVPSLVTAAPQRPAPEVETRSLDELHRAALSDGGKLVVYAGGDVPDAGAPVEKSFMQRFPGMQARVITDLSKYHDARIDQQLARGRLECDVAVLQTLHDFDRWKSEGQLLAYKPLDWEAVLPEFKDADGAFFAIGVIAFSNVANVNLIPEADAPRDAPDYLDPKLRGNLVLTYPHDDDAVLFEFDRIVAAYGWEWLDRLQRQDVQWIRGTVPARLVVQEGKKAATFTCSGPFAAPAGSPLRFQLPRRDVFHSWGQTAAILREARNQASARLFASWLCSKEATASRTTQWSVRRDVPAAGGYGPVDRYNTDPQAFRRFMQDRARIERLKTGFEHLIGPVSGPNPTGARPLPACHMRGAAPAEARTARGWLASDMAEAWSPDRHSPWHTASEVGMAGIAHVEFEIDGVPERVEGMKGPRICRRDPDLASVQIVIGRPHQDASARAIVPTVLIAA